MSKELRIVILEDSEPHAELLESMLLHGGLKFSAARVDTRNAFQAELERHMPDLILSDYALPTFDGCEALTIAKSRAPDVPFIYVTGTMGEEVAIETLKNGATDYVLKTRLSRLVPAVERALRESEERRQRKRAVEKLRQSHEQLRALTAYLQHVREEERIRIAREVHDELGQALTGLKMDISWLAGRLPSRQQELVEKTRIMANHIDATIQTVRRIATELRPGILDDLGLVAAIEWQAAEFQKRTGIYCFFTTSVQETLWDQDFNTTFFRIFQEVLTNIVRHANASEVNIELSAKGNRLELAVRDNGRGITDEEIDNTKSIGLLGMRERAELMGGDVSICGSAARGTTVVVSIPLPRHGLDDLDTP